MSNKKDFEGLKGEYNSIKMSDDAYRKMRMRMDQAKKENRRAAKEKSLKVYRRMTVAAAAALAIAILPNTSAVMAQTMGGIPVLGNFFKLVTVREYHSEDSNITADVEVGEIAAKSAGVKGTAENKGAHTSKQINSEIKKATEDLIGEFKTNLENKGYHDIKIKTSTVATSDRYFTVELFAYQGMADGFEEYHFYTIDLSTGERVKLEDLFKPGSNYKDVIAKSIEKQMREQMEADDSVIYWVDDELIRPDLKELIKDVEFYINDKNNLVICFGETDVAPAYMGAVRFEIERKELADILI